MPTYAVSVRAYGSYETEVEAANEDEAVALAEEEAFSDGYQDWQAEGVVKLDDECDA